MEQYAALKYDVNPSTIRRWKDWVKKDIKDSDSSADVEKEMRTILDTLPLPAKEGEKYQEYGKKKCPFEKMEVKINFTLFNV